MSARTSQPLERDHVGDANYLARPRVLCALMLVDAFGREVTDIRVSVTKRCNFGCIYCHDEGLGPILRPRMPHEDEMSVEQMGRLLRDARESGIRSAKLTGGEPVVRLDMKDIMDRSDQELPAVSMARNRPRR